MFGFGGKKEQPHITHISGARVLREDEYKKYPPVAIRNVEGAEATRVGVETLQWTLPNAISVKKSFDLWLIGMDGCHISDSTPAMNYGDPNLNMIYHANLHGPLVSFERNGRKTTHERVFAPDHTRSHDSRYPHYVERSGVLVLDPRHKELNDPRNRHPAFTSMMQGGMIYLQPDEHLSDRLLRDLKWIQSHKTDVLTIQRRIKELIKTIAEDGGTPEQRNELNKLLGTQTTFEQLLANRRIASLQALPKDVSRNRIATNTGFDINAALAVL